jgi:formamidopyrimidine-DNA glycosylase
LLFTTSMPELPEVQSVVNHLAQNIKGKVFVNAKVLAPKMVSSGFIKEIKDQKIKDIRRRAKMIVIKFQSGKFLVIHLKMTGQLIYVNQQGQIAGGGHPINSPEFNLSRENKFTRVILYFNDKSRLLFHDIRKFGWLKIISQEQLLAIDKKHGLEPLSSKFSLVNFKKILNRRPNLKIKQLLLLQELIAGIGNIYADESLFKAKILPYRQVKSLTSKEVKLLYRAIKVILKEAVRLGGTSVNTFVHPSGAKGSYVEKLKVYQKGGQKCGRCGQVLKKTRIAGRGTVYCPNCQQ